ncbi:MAG: UDP-glucose 4-epimerase GalE [Flavobacteriales bacterium]|nr:UDP-glucose 4-epimerase GalE [Flavobacteriales bacterium]|tara:strand:+ start:5975 stop:6988 length:1014 start_codon:yes stop_codon:yes gene_type:complete
MNKVIVTGGAGYIGSHTCLKLIEKGYNPIIIDNLSNTSIENVKGVESITNKKLNFYEIDCCDAKKINGVLKKENGIIGAMHFAAYKSVEESVRLPKKYINNNLKSLKSLIKVMQNNNLNNLIFSSSCNVYGRPDRLPVDENVAFKKAESPYAETKQLCEKIIEESTIFSVCLRYFNAIGSHNSGLIGERSADKPANLVPIICEVASGKREKLVINGNDYNTYDGSCVRDYIHVEDLATAHINALDYCIKNRSKSVFNVGTGQGLSVIETVRIFEEVNNIKLNCEIGPRRNGDVAEIYSDTKKSDKYLNWKAKLTVKEALKSAWNWQIKKKNSKISIL